MLTENISDAMDSQQLFDNIVKLLDDLATAKAKRTEYEQAKQALIDEVLTDEIKQKLADIDEETKPQFANVDASIAVLENSVKALGVGHGATVKGTFLQAVFNKGRVSWDNKALDGYSKAHPELLEYKKQGDPYVSIRGV